VDFTATSYQVLGFAGLTPTYRAELLLVDEERGRAIAQRLDLRVIGLLGVLIEAKHRGLIDAVNSILDVLVIRAGFWVIRDLYVRVLQAAGENPSATN
jgi:uncharacterized protein